MDKSIENLPIVEVFTSIQGEGCLTGTPSVFVRVSGCNLRCCFKDSICDTPYTSFKPEKGYLGIADILKEFTEHPNVTNMVITGGEPMLYSKAIEQTIEEVAKLVKGLFVTVETNGTIAPELVSLVDLWSISPKLSTSVPIPGKTYNNPHYGNDSWTFSEERCEELNKIRFNPEAIAQMIDTGMFQLKFVYSGPESIASIDEFLKVLEELDALVRPYDVMLMPEGTTVEQITKNAQEAAQVCIERGWTLTDRLHLRIWGDKRGV